jgi:hypothetical protein
MKRCIFYISTVMLFFSYCKSDDDGGSNGTSNADYINREDCNGVAPTYSGQVKSIFDGSCALIGCHNTTTSTNNNVDLSGYDGIRAAFNNKKILCSINWGEGCITMPKGGSKIAAINIKNITCWAKNGFPQ